MSRQGVAHRPEGGAWSQRPFSIARGANPFYLLILLYAALVPLEQIYPILGLQNSIWKPYRVIGALLIILILIRGRIWFDRFDRRIFLLHMVGALISVFYALFLNASLDQTIWFLTIIAIPAGVYVATKSWIWEPKQVDRIFMAWTIVNVASVVYSMYAPGESFRISGFFESPALFSLSLSVSVLYLFTKAMGSGTSQPRLYVVLTYLVVALFLMGGMFASGTRASLLGAVGSIVLTMLALIVTKRRSYMANSAKVLAILVTLGIVASLSFGQLRFSDRLLARYDVVEAVESEERVDLWRAAFALGFDTGFMGVGAGRYLDYHAEYVRKVGATQSVLLDNKLGIHSD